MNKAKQRAPREPVKGARRKFEAFMKRHWRGVHDDDRVEFDRQINEYICDHAKSTERNKRNALAMQVGWEIWQRKVAP